MNPPHPWWITLQEKVFANPPYSFSSPSHLFIKKTSDNVIAMMFLRFCEILMIYVYLINAVFIES
jgi:hypothetical protein